MLKHATSSVFLFTPGGDGWCIGLIHHPRLRRWMLPGGHVEPEENPAEAALREVGEETGLTARALGMFDDSRNGAWLLFDRIDHLARGGSSTVATGVQSGTEADVTILKPQ